MPADDPATPDWTARRMRGGTWVEVVDEDTDALPARVDRVVTVKMTAAELAELDAAIAPLGLKRNRALRIAARRIGGFVEAAPEEVALLRDAVRQLGGIARNVNQIARAANRTRDAGLPGVSGGACGARARDGPGGGADAGGARPGRAAAGRAAAVGGGG